MSIPDPESDKSALISGVVSVVDELGKPLDIVGAVVSSTIVSFVALEFMLAYPVEPWSPTALSFALKYMVFVPSPEESVKDLDVE